MLGIVYSHVGGGRGGGQYTACGQGSHRGSLWISEAHCYPFDKGIITELKNLY